MNSPIKFKLYFEELRPSLNRGRVKGKAASRKFWTRSSKLRRLAQKRLAAFKKVIKHKREITIHLKWLFILATLIQFPQFLPKHTAAVYADPINPILQFKAIAPLKPLEPTKLASVEPLQAVYIPPAIDYSYGASNAGPAPAYNGYNGYDYGNCTYYVKSVRTDMPNNLGNADTWYDRAAVQGFAVGYTPRIGAVAAAIGYMHVAIVIGISGNMVTVREMNYQGFNIISTRTTLASEFRYIY